MWEMTFIIVDEVLCLVFWIESFVMYLCRSLELSPDCGIERFFVYILRERTVAYVAWWVVMLKLG